MGPVISPHHPWGMGLVVPLSDEEPGSTGAWSQAWGTLWILTQPDRRHSQQLLPPTGCHPQLCLRPLAAAATQGPTVDQAQDAALPPPPSLHLGLKADRTVLETSSLEGGH